MPRHQPADLADKAAAAVHDLALLTRPAITTLDLDDLERIAGALADLAAALPQPLNQLRRYLPDGTSANRAAAGLDRAGAAAEHLAALLDAARQAFGDTAEPAKPNLGGVRIQPTERGQSSGGVDTSQPRSMATLGVGVRLAASAPRDHPQGIGLDPGEDAVTSRARGAPPCPLAGGRGAPRMIPGGLLTAPSAPAARPSDGYAE